MLGLSSCDSSQQQALPTSTRLLEASRAVASHEFGPAYRAYHGILEIDDLTTEQRAEALYGLATAAWHRTPPDSARITMAEDSYREVVTRYPDSAFAPLALRNLARIAESIDYPGDESKPRVAESLYRDILERWPDHKVRHEITLRLTSNLWTDISDEPRVEEGIMILEDYLRSNPSSPYLAAGWELLADLHAIERQAPERALQYYLLADAAGFVDHNRNALNFYRITELARKVGYLDTEILFHQRMITELPNSGRAYESLQRLVEIAIMHPERDFKIPNIRRFQLTEIPEGNLSAVSSISRPVGRLKEDRFSTDKITAPTDDLHPQSPYKASEESLDKGKEPLR